jgi:CelD/BcsL family acetyltransferase involved in cellulose biosynthesis
VKVPDRVRVVTLRTPSDLAPWRDQIDALAVACAAPVFSSSAWLAAWWRHLAPDAEVLLLVDEGADGVEGIWPLARLGRRAHRLVPVRLPYVGVAGSGPGAADHLRPLTSSPASASRLLAAAAGAAGRTTLLLEGMAGETASLLAGGRRGRIVSETPCPRIDLAGIDSADVLWCQKRRSNLRRTFRRCKDLGFDRQWVRLDPSNLHLLDELQQLHELLWRSRGRPGLIDDTRRAFLAEVATQMQSGSSAWLQVIGDGSHAVAAQLAFEFGPSMCSYATGRDPALRRLGLGVLLEAGGIERAIDRGLDRYDFLRGTEPHKLELGGIPTVDLAWCAPRGVRGRVLCAREVVVGRRDAWT